MDTQVIFKMPQHLKQQALKKAKAQGLTLKALYTTFTEDYIQGRITMHLQYKTEPEIEVLNVSESMQKDMDKIGELLVKKRAK